jgi:hypothetical protein
MPSMRVFKKILTTLEANVFSYVEATGEAARYHILKIG